MSKSPITVHHTLDTLAGKRHDIELALQRFIHDFDVDALHDLRVALRRLQSQLRTLDHTYSQQRERLRDMLKATNRARDLEVYLQINEQLALSLNNMKIRWQQQLSDEMDTLQQTLQQTWKNTADMLPVSIGGNILKQLAARQLGKDILRLNARRESLCQQWDDRTAHKLRISGKHIRYLLEPIAQAGSPVENCIAQMKGFQDLLGEYHDYITLKSEIEGIDDEAKNAITILKAKMSRLRERYTAKHCHTRELEHTLQTALHSLETEAQSERGNVV